MGGAEEVSDEDMAKESSPQGEESMSDISPSKESEGELHDQGIKCKNIVDPELSKAAKDLEGHLKAPRRRKASSTPASTSTTAKTSPSWRGPAVYEAARHRRMALATVVVPDDPISGFKVQRMNWRVSVPPHAGRKFFITEEDLFKQLCNMDPIYERRPVRLGVVFRIGDVRSTLSDRLMEKASDIRESALKFRKHSGARPRSRIQAKSSKQRGAFQCNAPLLPVSWCG